MRHYVRIASNVLVGIARTGAFNGDGKRLFNDLFGGGSFRVAMLSPNDEGPRFAIQGATTVAHAGVDRWRSRARDCLLVYAVRHNVALPHTVEHKAELELLPNKGAFVEQLPARDVLPFLRSAYADDDSTVPNERLAAALAAASPVLLARLRPGPDAAPEEPRQLLGAWRTLWTRFKLQLYVGADYPQRLRGLLSGIFASTDTEDLAGLARTLGVRLLNSYALEEPDQKQVIALVEARTALPLRASTRAALWSWTLRALAGDDFKRELFEAAAFLKRYAENTDDARAWAPPLRRALEADLECDPALRSLHDGVAAPDELLARVARWAWSLQFDAAPAQPAAPVSPPPPQAAPAPAAAVIALPERTTLPPRSPSPPVVETESEQNIFDRWLLRLSAGDPAVLSGVFDGVSTWAQPLVALSSGAATVSACLELSRLLGDAAMRIATWSQALPNPEHLAKDVEDARRAYDRARSVLGDRADVLLESPLSLFPDELSDIADLVPRLDAIADAPPWMWGEHADERWKSLADPGVRTVVKAVLAALDEAGEDRIPAKLAGLAPPSDENAAANHLVDELRRYFSIRRALAGAAPEHRAWVDAALTRGEEPGLVQRALDRLDALRGRVSAETFTRIVERAGAAGDPERRDHLVRASAQTVDEIAAFLGSALDVTPAQFDRKLEPKLQASKPAGAVLEVRHHLVEKNTRAPIAFRPLEKLPYGETIVPIELRCVERHGRQVRIDCEVLTKQRSAWPTSWPGPTPGELTIEASNWREQQGAADFSLAFALHVPIRRPQPMEKFELAVTVLDERGVPLSSRQELKWDVIGTDPIPLSVAWKDACDPEFVKQHPVGPQGNPDILVQRVDQGASFAVLAPRRFGKTTLVRYLESLREDRQVVIPAAVTCTRYYTGARLDHERLWKAVSDNLQAELGAGLPMVDGELPAAHAFDHVRKAAFGKGKRTVLLLFDEAQLFFPKGARGYEIGDRLKDLLETEWAANEKKGLSGLIFGFVGLPGLENRAGTNLVGRLRPIRKSHIDEAELRTLLLKITKNGLETTPEARREIARQSDNLLVLRQILDGLVRRLKAEGRAWAMHSDVVEVVNEIKQRLQEEPEAAGTELTIRDALNEAETVNEWEPSAALPVAVALVKAGFPRIRLEEAVPRAAEVLTQWAGELQDTNVLHRLVFDGERVREQLAVLRDRGLFTETRITSELMHAWLKGLSSAPMLNDDGFRSALFACAARRVRRPRVLEPLSEGGQATVFTFKAPGDEVLVWREAVLTCDEDRRRFLETSGALTALMRRARLREPGFQYVYDVREMGLQEGTDDRAVQIYRYVPGKDLSAYAGKLAPELVAEVGHKLSLALAWLHRHNVLHRDISPRNVILSAPDLDPVLIDFGLAHTTHAPMGTRVASEFAAPEVTRATPRWTRAADVWSLSRMLSIMLRKGERIGISALLANGVAEDAEARPTADELVERFGEVLARLALSDRRAAAWREVEKLVAKDVGNRAYYQVLQKCRAEVENLLLGFHTELYDRCALVADICNQIVEASDRRLSLGRVSGQFVKGAEFLATREMATATALRNYRGHGSKDKSDVRTPARELETHMLAVGKQLSDGVGLASIQLLVAKMLAGAGKA